MVDVAETFEAQAARVGAAVHRAGREAAVVSAVRVLLGTGCTSVAFASVLPERPLLLQASTHENLWEFPIARLSPTRRADGGVSVARLGVAETGSVLLHSSPEDRRVELCVDIHLVLIDVETLVPTLDEAFEVLREISSRAPAYASLVSGPSRSADIERTLTIGVHGPRELHILLVGSSPPESSSSVPLSTGRGR